MAKTMYWREVPGVIQVAVHTSEAPSDEDWDSYLQSVAERAKAIKGILVYSLKVGPSSAQRARSVKAFEEAGVDLKVSIMTASRLTQGVVTALSWALGTRIKAFSTHDFEAAAEYLELDAEERFATRVVLKQLARLAEVEVDAFADESGQFRKKFGQ